MATRKRSSKTITKSFGSIGGGSYSTGDQLQEQQVLGAPHKNPRGLEVYTISQVLAATGRDQEGRLLTWGVENPYFFLTVQQRNDIYKLSTPVFGIVSARMNYISAREFDVIPVKDREDQIYDELKSLIGVYQEYRNSTDARYIVARAKIAFTIRQVLPECLPDLSNFGGALMRWRKRIKIGTARKTDEIKAWLHEPNIGTTWTDWVKKVVYDLHIHGGSATYKQKNKETGLVENFDTLPGGSVYRMKDRYFSNVYGFIQIVSGYEPQVLFQDECCYMEYLPNSTQSHSFIPLEALINSIAEDMLYARMMADFADGTKPPEKIVIVTNPNDPFGNFDAGEQTPMPLDPNEQKRLESKINEPRKYPIITMSGNDAKVIDISKENTMALESERQKDIREMVGYVFQASNMEMSLTGSDDTSGRSTSEAQDDISHAKGRVPIMRLIEERVNRDILRARYGLAYMMEFKKSKDDLAERQLDQIKLANGEMTINELREREGFSLFEGRQFDLPQGSGGGEPSGSSIEPLHVKSVE